MRQPLALQGGEHVAHGIGRGADLGRYLAKARALPGLEKRQDASENHGYAQSVACRVRPSRLLQWRSPKISDRKAPVRPMIQAMELCGCCE